jgi:excisionase family DNA binding protein
VRRPETWLRRPGAVWILAGMTDLPSPTSPPSTAGRLLTADDVAVLLGVPRTFVYALSRRGVLPTVHVGDRYVRYRFTAVQDWIAEQETARPTGQRR